MVDFPSPVTGHPTGRAVIGLLLAVLGLVPGCVLLERSSTVSSSTAGGEASVRERVITPKPAPGTRPTRIGTFWQPNVVYAPDPTRNGAPNPGMACRMWLFDENVGHPLLCDGKLCVDLYDISPRQNGEVRPVHLEQWQLDPVSLRKLAKPDILGDGYTLFFPWGTFRPDITRVQMKLRFDPGDGSSPLFSEPSSVTLGSSVGDVRTNTGSDLRNNHGPIGQNIVTQSNKPR